MQRIRACALGRFHMSRHIARNEKLVRFTKRALCVDIRQKNRNRLFAHSNRACLTKLDYRANNLSTSPVVSNNEDDRQSRDKDVIKITKVFHVKNPFEYFALKIKMFLMKFYFDKDFNEEEFLQGAQQAVCYITGKLSEGKLKELKDVLTSEGAQCGRQLYHNNVDEISSIKVDSEDFVNVTMDDIGFEYGDGGRKWAYVLVTCFCKAKESITKTFGNIDVTTTRTRMLRYSFKREYTPGVTGGWLIDRMEHLVNPL